MSSCTRFSARGLGLLLCCAAFGLACLMFQGASPAYAAQGDMFVTADGTVGGKQISAGTDVSYMVLTEPEGEEHGSVQLGDGKGVAIDQSYTGALAIPETVEHDGSSYDVVVVGDNAAKAASLSSLSVSSTVERIDSNAFYNCYSLASVDFAPDGKLNYIRDHAFYLAKCNGALTELVVPDSVGSIGAFAFYGQALLKDITLPKSMERLGDHAFAYCSSLESFDIPEITAQSSGLGSYLLLNCENLERVTFLGDIVSADDGSWNGTRNFDGCKKLSQVIYCGKRFTPTYGFTGYTTWMEYGFPDCDPALYFTITYYPSKADAEAKTNALGYVRVRDDVAFVDVKPDMAASDERGLRVYEGGALPCPGTNAGWAYEGTPVLSAPVTESLAAWPADPNDLSCGSVQLPTETYDYSGLDVALDELVCDVNGPVDDSQYDLSFFRKDDAGSWVATADLVSVGEMRVVVTGKGEHSGTLSAEFSIDYAKEDTTFVDEAGICYRVIEPVSAGESGTCAVGDGTHLAVAQDFEGSLSIPETTAPCNSAVKYTVVGISDYAFGAAGTTGACTGLSGISLPETIESLGTSSFANCTSLKGIVLPASCVKIGARAFRGCTGLASVQFLAPALQMIGSYAFERCASLEDLVLPSFGTSGIMRDHAFANCVKLRTLKFAGTPPTSEPGTQFDGCNRLVTVTYTQGVWGYEFDSVPTVVDLTPKPSPVVAKKLNQTITGNASKTKSYKAAKSGSYKGKLKKAQTIKSLKSLFKLGSKTTLSFKVSSYGKSKTAAKYIKVSSVGKVSVKKKLKKGSYKVKIKVSAKATSKYNAANKTLTLTIRIR